MTGLVPAENETHHVMAGLVPAISTRGGAAGQSIGITGTSPVMTSEGTKAGDDRAGTVMTRWRRTRSWVTPSAVMAGLDPAIPM
ncbi:hypothetical protein KHP60_17465 [Microvirga sp. 3-52]|uniref:hypothetical protein n=1 Tax=Microvirga sp. 3-52 TaxID=2792425 RepID=UPI001AC97BB5|nr:hypothetical protein [Microvirga sp. 3-52]MBO1907082.1 hypothetical protein [Microvirga sp. 3-52]MBS7454122.1 hypothetical protein [Microvirga sp. 3-52]